MKIKIRFENRNTNALGIRVYRDTSPIDKNNLPPPYATIAGDAVEYIDENAIQDTVYYYMLEPFSESDSTFSTNITAVAGEYLGPGPKVLKRGDLNIGYFGRVSGADFINYNALIALANIPGTVNTQLSNTDDEWLKVAYNGKILFIAKRPIIHVSWSTLYENGLIYGVDGPGPREFNTLPEVNQLRKVNIRNTEFIIRSMTSAPNNIELPTSINTNTHNYRLIIDIEAGAGDDTLSFNSYNSVFDLTGSEWNDIMYKFYSVTPPEYRGPKFEILDIDLSAMNTTTIRYGIDGDGIFQNLISTSYFLSRGYVRSGQNGVFFPGYIAQGHISTNYYWRPVLEMVTN